MYAYKYIYIFLITLGEDKGTSDNTTFGGSNYLRHHLRAIHTHSGEGAVSRWIRRPRPVCWVA